MVSRKKDAYWHKIALVMIEHGLKPAQMGKVLKEIFPETEVNGRHIGAYKRRLTTEGMVIPARPTISLNEMMDIANGLVDDEDRFIYNCSVGSIKRSLKCFEFKMTAEKEVVDNKEEIDIWVSGLNQG